MVLTHGYYFNMTLKKEINRLKLCFDIRLLGDSSVKITIIHIDSHIHNYQNCVFFICNNGYTFEKSSNRIKYTIDRLIIPPTINSNKDQLSFLYTFVNNESRYIYLKKLKHNLEEFTRSDFFGVNLYSRVTLCDNMWFVY